jgi:hypothetical protein
MAERPTYCRSCGAHIRWCTTEGGKRIPVDYLPDHRGNLVLQRLDDGSWLASHEANVPMPPSPLRYVAHFATCDDPTAWRTGRPAA